MIAITDVFASVNDTIRAIFPTANVYKERINKLETPSLSVQLISYRTPQHSKTIINKKIDLDIIYFSKENTVFEALEAMEKLMSAFSMGIFVRKYSGGELIDKRFIHSLKTPEYKLVDNDLHFLISFDFADEFKGVFLTDDKKFLDNSEETRGLYEKKESDNPNDNKEFVEDVEFVTEEEKKKYQEENLKMMEILKLDYKL
jgi:hypothetical protein